MAVDTMKVSQMAARILAIPGGPDPDPVEISLNSSTGLVTATDGVTSDELQLLTDAGGSYNVTSVYIGDQVLATAGKYLTGNVSIKQERNFSEENIKKGVSMWGRVGTYEAAPDLKSCDSGWCVALNDGRTGFRYTLSSPPSDNIPDLLFFSSRLVDPSTYLPDNSWCPGACSYRRDGNSWYVTGIWMYKENGVVYGVDRLNEWLNTNQLEILREDNDIIVLLKNWMALPGSPVITGNYHKCCATWM